MHRRVGAALARTPSRRHTSHMSKPALDISELSPDQRLDLIADLWESLADHEVPISDEQEQELARRRALVQERGHGGKTIADIKAELLDEES